MSNKMANNKGFTLIEIIIVIIVLGVLSIFGFSFLSTAIHTYSMMEKQKSLFDEAAMAMERISRELRDAESISAPANPGDTSSILTFTKSHGSPEESTNYEITFQLSGTTLQREGSNIAEKVKVSSGFLVERGTSPDEDEITITLTLEETTGESITLRSYIYPKNLDYPDPAAPSGKNFGGHWQENFQ